MVICAPLLKPSRRFTSSSPCSRSSSSCPGALVRGVVGSFAESAPDASMRAVKACRAGVTGTGFSRNVLETVKHSNGSDTLVGTKAEYLVVSILGSVRS